MAEGALAGAQAQLGEEDVHKALLAFSAHDPERQGIRVCDLGACFRAMGEDVAESELFDMMCSVEASDATNTLNFDEFIRLVAERRQRLAEPVSQDDLAMAFTACGGDPNDEESFVKREMLVALIKGQFGLAIDIERMIEEIDEDGSGQIEFGEFTQLLSSVIELEGAGRRPPPPTPALGSYRK